MSSTDVTLGKYTSSSQHNNKISWEIYKRFGWNPSDTDGNQSSEAGMPVSVEYNYAGNVSSSFDIYMNTKATIRYEYVYFVAGSGLTLHTTTGEMSVTTPLTIVP